MFDWLFSTHVYLFGAALIPAVGVFLIYRGLWGDRSKGRPRCPRCWYDMRGSLPRLVCPECGHDPGYERRLYRSRRRRWLIALGLSVLLLSYPLVIVGGWWREQVIQQRLLRLGQGAR